MSNRSGQDHRDHQALLRVIDALVIRYEQNLNEQSSIFKLQTKLIQAAIDFHQNHKHVLPRLTSVKKNLDKRTLTLLGEEEREEDDYHQPIEHIERPVESVRVLNTLALPTRVQSSNGARIQQRLSQGRTALVVNRNYEYESDDIQAILTIRMRDYPNVHILAAAMMNEAMPVNSVASIILGMKNNNEIGYLTATGLVVPVDVGGHWIGLCLTMEKGVITSIFYLNSLENLDIDHKRVEDIKRELLASGLINKNVVVRIQGKSMQQEDGTSCGALLIENIYCHFKDRWWYKDNNRNATEGITHRIRKLHLDLLKEHRKDFFPGFAKRQAENQRTVASLTSQLQNHLGLFSTSTQGSRSQSSEKSGLSTNSRPNNN